jgi:hypothetical protein
MRRDCDPDWGKKMFHRKYGSLEFEKDWLQEQQQIVAVNCW